MPHDRSIIARVVHAGLPGAISSVCAPTAAYAQNIRPTIPNFSPRRAPRSWRTIESRFSLNMLGCAKHQTIKGYFHKGRAAMSQSKSSGSQNKQSARESEEDQAKRRAGKTDKSSQDHAQRTKAGTGKGAGGSAKAKQGH
jgi:hypothetical protein